MDTHTNGWPRNARAHGLFLALGVLALPNFVAASSVELDSLASLSLEELGEISVTSVSRQPQRLSESPSAIQVITSEDIRRSGASSIPEALRLASNLQVAQVNSQEWVITARGFSSDVGNKLLVMIDGRTVYTPLFSGVFWDRQDYLLEDIDRIEVISGPGGTLWGANAVNGVINIITRDAAQTQGLHVEAGAGSELQAFTGLRYGGTLNEDTSYRVYAKYSDRDGSVDRSGNDVNDDWHMSQAGFRIDGAPAANDSYTVQGDLYRSRAGVATGRRAETEGVNILGRWAHSFSVSSDMTVQMYFDRTNLELPTPALQVNGLPLAGPGVFGDTLETLDFDLQHGFALGTHNRLVWGLSWRSTDDDVDNSPGLAFFPEKLTQELYSAFVQDEITLIPERLILTVGTKFEHNDYTGSNTVPNARLQWNTRGGNTLWGAVSKAVRTPSRIDREISQPSPNQPPFNLVLLAGGPTFDDEKVVAWEAGYRAQANDTVSAAVSLFYNEYDDIRSTSLSPAIFPLYFENNLEGETYGLEFSANYQVSDWWRLSGAYNLLKEDIRVKRGAFDFNNALNETADPEHQISLRSAMSFSNNVELDASLRWVDALIKNNSGVADKVPAYAELNLRLGWRPAEHLEFSLVGQNLLDSQHPEFGNTTPTREEIERSIYGKITWRF